MVIANLRLCRLLALSTGNISSHYLFLLLATFFAVLVFRQLVPYTHQFRSGEQDRRTETMHQSRTMLEDLHHAVAPGELTTLTSFARWDFQ
jgi:hypothetical protein